MKTKVRGASKSRTSRLKILRVVLLPPPQHELRILGQQEPLVLLLTRTLLFLVFDDVLLVEVLVLVVLTRTLSLSVRLYVVLPVILMILYTLMLITIHAWLKRGSSKHRYKQTTPVSFLWRLWSCRTKIDNDPLFLRHLQNLSQPTHGKPLSTQVQITQSKWAEDTEDTLVACPVSCWTFQQATVFNWIIT